MAMLRPAAVLLCAAAAVATQPAAAGGIPTRGDRKPGPRPPILTPLQTKLLKDTARVAADVADAAKADALRALASPDFRRELAKLAPSLSDVPASELLSRWRAEVAAAELVHNIDVEYPGRNISVLEENPYFPNHWQVLNLGYEGQCKPDAIEETAEELLFHYPPFAKSGCPTFEEASDRMIYVAWNVFRIDAGNPHFGSFSLVFTSENLQRSLIAPIDTGIWEMGCQGIGNYTPAWAVVCNDSTPQVGWGLNGSRPLASADHFDHLLVANARLWNSTKITNSVSTPATDGGGSDESLPQHVALGLARLFARLVADVPYAAALPLYDGEGLMYYEANLAESVYYSDRGVKLVIASFERLFGQDIGLTLEKWCIKQNIMLVWALNPTVDDATRVQPTYNMNQRIYDPVVAAGTSVNATAALLGAGMHFEDTWTEVAEYFKTYTPPTPRPGGGPIHPELDRIHAAWAWKNLMDGIDQDVRTEPLRAKSCADLDGCVGVSPVGECLCYKQ